MSIRGALTLAVVATVISSCAPRMVYVRADGQRSSTDPVLAHQYEMDRLVCSGEMQKANVSGVTFTGGGLAGAIAAAERQNAVGQVAQGCMAQKGYVMVPEEHAPARLAEFAAIEAEKKRREAAAQAPLPTPQRKSRAANAKN